MFKGMEHLSCRDRLYQLTLSRVFCKEGKHASTLNYLYKHASTLNYLYNSLYMKNKFIRISQLLLNIAQLHGCNRFSLFSFFFHFFKL